MANINMKDHLFVMVQGKNGPERREVKNTAAESKLYKRLKDNLELEVRKSKRLVK